ncbi:MAG: DinB family protein [Gammaproteobacteria bacterium]|nr:DinB family protein [Gammaproteobacteria bacterium]
MIVQQYRVMAAYNRQVNRQVYAACESLSEAELKQDRGAFFSSILGTLNHLLLVDRLWLGGFTGNPVAFGSLDEELYGVFAELREERDRTDAEIITWADTLPPTELAKPFNERLTFPRWLAVTHFFNHQTHHRGQLSALLSQCGLDYGVTDLPWVAGMADLASAQ